jgi:hypothetical protein
MIDQPLAAFLQEGLDIHIGTRNERLEPNGARAIALVVEDDGRHVVVYMAATAATRVLPDLEANGHIAVVLGRPTDDRACQVKGTFSSARPARDDERPIVVGQWEGFLEKMGYIGVPRTTLDTFVTWPAVAIRLRATAVFNQTPGPGAGEPLK